MAIRLSSGRVLLLLFGISAVLLFSTAFSQCIFPSESDIETFVNSLVQSDGAEGANPIVNLIQYHPTCMAVANEQNFFHYLSIAVRYNVTTTSTVQRISQMQLMCSGMDWYPQSPLEKNRPETVFLTTRRDCYICSITAPVSVSIDMDTNCVLCDSTCEGGQGACIQVSGSTVTCCKYYDSVTKMCTNNCPAALVAANFTCDPCLNSPCQNGGMCTAQEGLNYTCNCSSAGNFAGENCNTCTVRCINGSTNPACTACVCTSGYTGSDCTENINDCDPNLCVNGRCIDEVGGYMCTCDPTWTGTNCDTCIVPNCDDCDSSQNPPVCRQCQRGFVANGDVTACVEICSTNPCQNGGTCTPVGVTYMYNCTCPADSGWIGADCSMCAQGYAMVDSRCVRCSDSNCVLCPDRQNMCTQCKEGFQSQTNNASTNQCVKKDEIFPVDAIIASTVTIIIVSVVMFLIVITVVIIASVINKKKKTDEYDYVEAYELPSSPNTRDHYVATSDNPAYGMSSGTKDHYVATSDNPAYGMSSGTKDHNVATSDNPAYGMHPASKPTQSTVCDELPIERTTTAIYENIPQ